MKKKPNSVKFLNANLIEIEGEHKSYGYGTYQVDLNEMTVHQIESMVMADSGTYTERFRSPYGLILTLKDESPGLYHQTLDGTMNRISSNFIPSDTLELQISDNGEKLIYLVKESGQMATYSLKTTKKKVVPGKLPEIVTNNFHNSVGLSPDGGYFMIYDGEGAYEEHSINVYGSDSGRRYAEEIQGTLPFWSPDGERLAFVYSGQLTDPNVLSNTRVGYIKFPEREIVYFDKISDEYIVANELYWSSNGNTLSFIRRNSGNGEIDLRSYNVLDGGLYSFELNQGEGAFPSTVSVSDSNVVMHWNDEKTIQIYDHEGFSQSMVERIDTISNFESSRFPYVLAGESLLFYQENQLIIQTGMSRESLQIDNLVQVAMHSEGTWVVAGVEADGSYKINVIARK